MGKGATHEHSVKTFVDVVNSVLGQNAMKIKYFFPIGLVLEYSGIPYPLGRVGETHVLTVAEQEAICRRFGLDQTLFGLDATFD